MDRRMAAKQKGEGTGKHCQTGLQLTGQTMVVFLKNRTGEKKRTPLIINCDVKSALQNYPKALFTNITVVTQPASLALTPP